jgi:hypothetical protein
VGNSTYPYTIAQDQSMILNASLYFDEADKPVFTSAKDKGNLQVRAQVLKAADPTQVVFTFLKKNPRVSNSYLTLNATADRTFAQAGATASDFEYYATSGLTILYSYSLDGGKTWFGNATTQNKVYVTLAKPKTALLYETVLYYGSTSRANALVDLPGAVAAFLGERETTRVDGTPMYYYGDWGTPNYDSVGALLNGADGRCGTWAMFFIDILRAQGLGTDSTILLGITPKDDKEGFMVPDWQFNSKALFKDNGLTLPDDYAKTLAAYPYADVPDTSATPWPPETRVPVDQTPYYKNNTYQWKLPTVKGDKATQEDVKDRTGVPGQNSSDPASLFGDHAIVKVVIAGQTKYYDPSYGTVYDSLLDFNNSLAGFYIGMDIDEGKFKDPNSDHPLDLNSNMLVDTVHVLAMKPNVAATKDADMSIKATDDKYKL